MITVIADDLTGAAEIAGVCLRYGVSVSFGIDVVPEPSAKVVVVATDSRSQTEPEAYKTHLKIAQQVFEKRENPIVFKKCDSVLRGHVLTELKALTEVSGKQQVLLQPSNPSTYRSIKNGVYYVGDVEIENTGFSADPDFPAKTSSVAELLLERTSEIISLPIQTGAIDWIETEGVYVPDCQSETDLTTNLELYNENVLIGGSAACFEQFLKKLSIISVEKEMKNLSFTASYVLVSGSTHPESVAFAKMLHKNGCPLLMFPEHLLAENCNENDILEFAYQAIETYVEYQKLVLRISDKNIQFKNSSKVLKSRLSVVAGKLISGIDVNEVLIEGGASAYDVLKNLNWSSFGPTENLAPGVVRMQNNLDKRKHITLKPGSYKWPKELIN